MTRQRPADDVRILIVEDNEDFCLLMQTVLQDAGYIVDCAACAEDAILMLEQQNSIAIAIIRTEMEYLKAGMADLRATNAAQTEKIEQLLAIVAEARGGWRTVMAIGGAAGAIGSAMTWIATHWKP